MKQKLMYILAGCGQKLGERPGLGKPRQTVFFHSLTSTRFPAVGPGMKGTQEATTLLLSLQSRWTAISTFLLYIWFCSCCLRISDCGLPVSMTAEVTNCSALTPAGWVG